MNIDQLLETITDLQHKIAVYGDIIEYLEEYLPSDIGDASETLSVNGCLEPVVSCRVLETILGEISDRRAESEKELDTLKSLEVAHESAGKKRKSRTKSK